MKIKFLNLVLILTSLIGYLEWGKDNHMFLFQGELEIMTKMVRDPKAVVHPFVLLPLFGQAVLVVTVFQMKPSKILTFIGIGCISLLLGFMFVIGVLSFNLKILISTVPFLATASIIVHHFRKQNVT